MKCPYRKQIKHYKRLSGGAYTAKYDKDVEEFEDCYKSECPAYTEVNFGGATAVSCKFVKDNIPIGGKE